jgi:hypothetical protein
VERLARDPAGRLCRADDRGRGRTIQIGRRSRPAAKAQVREIVIIAGRRSGKDSIASAIAASAAAFRNYKDVTRPGESASIMCLAVDIPSTMARDAPGTAFQASGLEACADPDEASRRPAYQAQHCPEHTPAFRANLTAMMGRFPRFFPGTARTDRFQSAQRRVKAISGDFRSPWRYPERQASAFVSGFVRRRAGLQPFTSNYNQLCAQHGGGRLRQGWLASRHRTTPRTARWPPARQHRGAGRAKRRGQLIIVYGNVCMLARRPIPDAYMPFADMRPSNSVLFCGTTCLSCRTSRR